MGNNYNHKSKNSFYYKNKKNKKNYNHYFETKKNNENIVNNKQNDVENTARINRELIDTFKRNESLQEDAQETPFLIKKENSEQQNELPKSSFKFNFKIAYVLVPVLLIIILLGTTYAYFNYYKTDSAQADIQAGDVYVTLKENPTPTLTILKAYPRTVEEARARNDNYVDFTILGKNTSETTAVLYSITLSNGEDQNGKIRINPQYLLIDLYTLDSQNNETMIVDSVPYSQFNSLDLSAINNIPINTNSEISIKYRLRAWISDKLLISDTEQGAAYTQAQFNSLYANIKVMVSTQLTKNSLPISVNANKSNVENGVSFIRTTVSNNYNLEDEGEFLSSNDTVEYQVTNPDNLLYFSYVDSRGNEDTADNTSLDLTYLFNKNESVDVKIFTKSKNDSNVDTTVHFKIIKNGTVIREYDQVVNVVG